MAEVLAVPGAGPQETRDPDEHGRHAPPRGARAAPPCRAARVPPGHPPPLAHRVEQPERHDGDTFRAAYTVRFKAAVHVLHAFQKKAKRGAETPKPDIELVRSRLRTTEQHHRYAHGEE